MYSPDVSLQQRLVWEWLEAVYTFKGLPCVVSFMVLQARDTVVASAAEATAQDVLTLGLSRRQWDLCRQLLPRHMSE